VEPLASWRIVEGAVHVLPAAFDVERVLADEPPCAGQQRIQRAAFADARDVGVGVDDDHHVALEERDLERHHVGGLIQPNPRDLGGFGSSTPPKSSILRRQRLVKGGGSVVEARRLLVVALIAGCVSALTALQQSPALPRPEGSSVALVGGTLIDGTGAAPVRNSVVLIRGERIERIGTTESVTVGPDYERISTEGMTVLPGMWDLHVHLMYGGHPNGRFWFDTYTPQFESVTIPASARQMLMAGVTSVRDLGAPPGIVNRRCTSPGRCSRRAAAPPRRTCGT
jgi:hypothetical protein